MSRLNKTDHGLVTMVDPGSDIPVLVSKTVMCVHCGGQFELHPPKRLTVPMTAFEARKREAEGKKIRGWCQNCNGYICGPSCNACVPVEQYLENIEKGRDPNFRPIVASVPPNFE